MIFVTVFFWFTRDGGVGGPALGHSAFNNCMAQQIMGINCTEFSLSRAPSVN